MHGLETLQRQLSPEPRRNSNVPIQKINGPHLHARALPNQRTEANIGCNVLNQMTNLGIPSLIK
jgi:hypothetical protein